LEASGAFRLSGRSLPYGERTGYGAFVEQLKKLAGIYETDSPDEAARKLAETLRDVFGGQGPDEVLGHLTALIGAGAADAVADQQSLFYSVRRFCEALAAKRPTLFVFEDIHWADETLLRLLRSLAERVREVPALFMTLARPELLRDRPEWGGGLPSYSALLLEPLSSDATRKLVMQLVGGEQAGAAARRVEVIAEGNPLFIEELAASVAEGTSDPGAELPTNLRSIIAARLDSLASDEKKLVLNASVVGKVFWRGVVAHLGVNGATDELLDLLEAKDFIRRERSSRFGDDSEFTFKHMLIREVAYSTLPKATRRKLHASVANFLEQASEKKSPEVGALLAHHYKEAGEAAKAVHYLLAVAGNARMAWAKGEAISAYEEALVLLSDSDPEKAIQIRLKKAETFVESADFQRAAAELTGLLDSLSGRDLLTAELALARSFYWMADVGRIEEHGRKAIELVESLGAEDLRGSALGVLCLSAGMNGEIARAVELGDEALRVWPSDGPEGDLSSFIGVTGLHRYWRGDFQSAVDLARRGYEIGSNVFHVEGLISNGAQLALALASQGKFEDALSVLSRVLERADELGPSVFASRAMVIGGGILRDTLDAAGARKMVEEGIEMGKQVGFPMSPVQGAIDLVFLDVLDGEPGRAQKAIPVLREQAENLKGFHQWLAGSRVAEAAAEAALAAGSFEEAANAATDSIERARRHGRAKYELAGKTVLGRALAAMNSLDEATRELKTAAELGRRLKSPQLLFPAVHALSAVLSQAGRDEEAAAAAGEAAAAVAAMEAGLPPSRREAFRSRATELIAAGLP
ncbi:MAG: ATP-binding protein, partial [Actinomycetota bacterium]